MWGGVREQLVDGHRMIRAECRRAPSLAEVLAAREALESMHGDARRGMVREIRRLSNKLADGTEAGTDHITTAANVIAGKPA